MVEDNLPTEPRQQGEYDDYDSGPGRSAQMIWGLRAAGLIVAGIVWLLLGSSEGLSPDGRAVAAIGTLMAIWWMSEAIPLSATSLLPIVLIPMLTDRTVSEATAPYASSIVFLFLGGFLIAIAMEKWNLPRRIALLTLRKVGVEPKRIVLGMMLATGSSARNLCLTATSSAGKRRRSILPATITDGLALAMVSQPTVGHSSSVWMMFSMPSADMM